MLGKKPNKVYDPFPKAGLGYTNPERLKKVIAEQPKMYDGDLIHSNKLVIHSTDSEETLEDAEEIQNKMRHKMVQIDYEKLNALYETFVPQQELSVEQTYFSIPSTSDNGSKSKDVPSKSPEQQKHELLKIKLEKSASDSRDIQANLIKRIKTFENEFQRSQAQSIAFELKLQHQKEKMDCDISWKAKFSTLHDENLFNSIKATRAQHQNEINEMFEDVTQKTYAYADVRAQNQDLLMTISKLTSKLKTIDKGKHVNTKFDKSETLGQLLCVTSFNKNLAIKAKNVSNTKVTSDSSKIVNDVNDGLNMLCISCGLDVFLHSHEKCVVRNALTRKSSVKRALFTSPVTAKSKGLGATSVVAKSRFSVAKTPTTTNKVSSVSPLSQKSSQSRILSSYMKNKIATFRKWQKWFEYRQGTVRFRNDHFAANTGYGDYVQGNLTICHVYYVEGLGHNLFSVGQFYDRDLEVAFRSNTCYVRNLEGDDLLTGSRDSNLYTISISDMAASSLDIYKICHQFHQQHLSIDRLFVSMHSHVSRLNETIQGSYGLITVGSISMQDELNQFKRLDVWELVECPVGRNIIKVKWIWKNKTNAENTVIQNKSRLVAKGYGQEEGIDFEESFAPVARMMLSVSLLALRIT
ncbi:retrovirus-related pol polyprotein from transposon TNT 1-94 [Tanacetum coccineum]